MSTLLTILHVIVCLFLMLTVLLQEGNGGGMGGAFGGGNAATVFGGSGASTFLRNLTAVGAAIFMATSMVLAYIASHNAADSLAKFGESQAALAHEKQDIAAKAHADTAKGSGSANGSASGSSAGSNAPSMAPPTTAGSSTGSAGLNLQTAPTPPGPTGSTDVPAEAPANKQPTNGAATMSPPTTTAPAKVPAALQIKPGDNKTPDQRLRDSVK
jgi:preprotein translocase subunit SecG